VVALDALRWIGAVKRRHGRLVAATDETDPTDLLDLWLAVVDDLRALRDTLNRLDSAARKAVGQS
jgi:hypothetical protein